MAKELLSIQIQPGRSTIDWDFGHELISAFGAHDRRLAPQTFEVWNDKKGDFSSTEDAKPFWAGIGTMRVSGSLSEFRLGLTWRRKNTTKYQAEIHHESQNLRGTHTPARLSFYGIPHKSIDWATFAEKLYQITQADFGFLHIHRDAHKRADLGNRREPTWYFRDWTPTHISQIGWSTFLGPQYSDTVSNVDFDGLDASIKNLSHGTMFTLSNNAMDVIHQYEEINRRRAALKSRFPVDFFNPEFP